MRHGARFARFMPRQTASRNSPLVHSPLVRDGSLSRSDDAKPTWFAPRACGLLLLGNDPALGVYAHPVAHLVAAGGDVVVYAQPLRADHLPA